MSAGFALDFIERVVALRLALRRQATYWIGTRGQLGSPDDFVQDTIVTALRSADRFEDDNLSGWLVAILRGHIRNARRRAAVRVCVPLSPPCSEDNEDGGEFDLPVAASQETALELGDVVAALRTLSEADQQVIVLARVDGLSHEQIATRLGLQVGTVYARLSRATARLRAAYDAEPAAAPTPACAMHPRAA
ncbi:MAG: sigma-70 family RNA polymerase sigma factor [Rhodopseudomonas palustris]|uniref:Sigma-70 family RNA polymerase sigma factor n=1 Tax=Rhodopseudomonas palustris TaxID=1076 RepID=A0A933RZV8_RHOPL|nr:sigma-70 family RNA polymerase sigma factor [Rhodopseudomonas palustris]